MCFISARETSAFCMQLHVQLSLAQTLPPLRMAVVFSSKSVSQVAVDKQTPG